MKPHFIDYTSSLRRPTKEQTQNSKSALKEIGRVVKGSASSSSTPVSAGGTDAPHHE